MTQRPMKMTAFGRRKGGGRRRANRTPALLPALVTTIARSHSAVLINVSATGARIRGSDLPDVGSDLVLKVDSVEAFGTVQWVRQNLCGVEFEQPLLEGQVDLLRAEGSVAMLTKLSPEERLAMQDWTIGLAR